MDETSQYQKQKNLAFGLAGGFVSIVAILLHITQMYLMAAAIFLVPAVAWALGRLLTQGLACERVFPPSIHEDTGARVLLRIKNTSRLPRFYIRAYDDLPAWLLRRDAKIPMILQLEPGEVREIEYDVDAIKRGAYTVGPLKILTTDPLGLTRFAHILDSRDEMLVLPEPLALRRPILDGGAFGWRGEQEGSRRGAGMDFYGVRDYRSGDELRRVHWRTTARTGRLVVAEQTQGEASHAIVALDLHGAAYRDSGTGKQSALEYGVKLAATLVDDLIRAGHDVQLVLGDGDDAVISRRDIGTLPFMERLARAEAVSSRSLAQELTDRAADVPHGATLMCITPRADPALRSVLGEFIARGIPVGGFLIDRSTFADEWALKSAAQADPAANAPLPGRIVNVRRGDDLVSLIESMTNAR